MFKSLISFAVSVIALTINPTEKEIELKKKNNSKEFNLKIKKLTEKILNYFEIEISADQLSNSKYLLGERIINKISENDFIENMLEDPQKYHEFMSEIDKSFQGNRLFDSLEAIPENFPIEKLIQINVEYWLLALENTRIISDFLKTCNSEINSKEIHSLIVEIATSEIKKILSIKKLAESSNEHLKTFIGLFLKRNHKMLRNYRNFYREFSFIIKIFLSLKPENIFECVEKAALHQKISAFLGVSVNTRNENIKDMIFEKIEHIQVY